LTPECLKTFPESTINSYPYSVNNLGILKLLSYVLGISTPKFDNKQVSHGSYSHVNICT